ncbi:hypothetical protein KI387_004067, partial [Taxus chinensis]
GCSSTPRSSDTHKSLGLCRSCIRYPTIGATSSGTLWRCWPGMVQNAASASILSMVYKPGDIRKNIIITA